jgi:predicted metal-dependent phosphoesterase TrpH
MFCDLHTHSTASDGTDAPEALAILAQDAGLSALALTDHDTVAGVAACAAAAKKIKLAFAPGIELSASPNLGVRGSGIGDRGLPSEGEARGTLHILGLFIDPDAGHWDALERELREARAQRNPQIIANLNKLGVRIDYDEVTALAGGQVVGRPHIAQVMVSKGYVKTVHEAFAKYIGQGRPAYARKDRLSAAAAIEAIHQANGLSFLAHPPQLGIGDDDQLEHYLKQLVELGLDGIETRHSDHSPDQVRRYTQLATQFDLLVSGGSDYHGSRKAIALGAQRVPLSVYEALRAAVG